MSCADRERSLALFAGGELGDAESLDLERHLHGCAHCRGVLDELTQLRELLGEPLAPEADVAAGVMRTLRRRRTVARLAIAAAIIIAVAAGFLIPAGTRAVMPLEVAVRSPAAPELHLEKPTAGETACATCPAPHSAMQRKVMKRTWRRHSVARGVDPSIAASADAASRGPAPLTVVVKLVTDDPDVVILWLGG